MIGRSYRRRYGYPWRWAIPAEIAWHVEHLPFNYEGQVFAPLARWGYRQRKALELRGFAAKGDERSADGTQSLQEDR